MYTFPKKIVKAKVNFKCEHCKKPVNMKKVIIFNAKKETFSHVECEKVK